MKAAVSDFGSKDFFMTVNANFIRLGQDDIREDFLHIADKVIMPGDRITLIGKADRKARSIHLNESDFLEYRGTFTDGFHTLAVFAVNGSAPEGLYESFFYLDHKQLCIMTNYGQSATDIQANEIHVLEEIK
ncbi:hypothetical protein GCM10022378_11460 [Salinicoccus jeotgali]|uniref:Uncharacterized protein n=1 Tax=Salinicoccus jeotgali TaxID=381634 RepID=A0ABP7ER74_9STAP